MQDYKIKVNTEAESKEVQELFFELGYSWNGNKEVQERSYPVNNKYWIVTKRVGMFHCLKWGTGHDSGKTIYLRELRDMVKLKQNLPNLREAAKSFSESFSEFFREVDFWGKPKEYLHKLDSGNYQFTETNSTNVPDDWVEVPEGSEAACVNHEGSLNFYKKIGEKWALKNKFCWTEWYIPDAFKLPCGYDPYSGELPLVWQRETLNDKVATAEAHRQDVKELEACGEALQSVKCGDDVTRAIEAFKIMSGKDVSLDEHVVRDFISVYELVKQLKG